MDFFQKLSDPIYFSKFSNRAVIVMSILFILFCFYLIYLGYYNTKPGLTGLGLILMTMSISNIIRSWKRLKKLS